MSEEPEVESSSPTVRPSTVGYWRNPDTIPHSRDRSPASGEGGERKRRMSGNTAKGRGAGRKNCGHFSTTRVPSSRGFRPLALSGSLTSPVSSGDNL